jgi:hypothetical protein
MMLTLLGAYSLILDINITYQTCSLVHNFGLICRRFHIFHFFNRIFGNPSNSDYEFNILVKRPCSSCQSWIISKIVFFLIFILVSVSKKMFISDIHQVWAFRSLTSQLPNSMKTNLIVKRNKIDYCHINN